MAWCTVGYHAVEESIYEGLVEKDCSGVWLTQIKPMQWHHTPLAAISQTKKSTARKLGAALSNTLSGERGSGTKPGKSRSHVQAQVALAMERPNYIVFSLKTKENIADMCGKKILHPLPEGLGFEMTKPFDLFEPLLLPGEWCLEFSSLGLRKEFESCNFNTFLIIATSLFVHSQLLCCLFTTWPSCMDS